MTAFSVLAMRPVSFLNATELADWGNEYIQRLADHFGREKTHTYKDPTTKETKVYKLLQQVCRMIIKCGDI